MKKILSILCVFSLILGIGSFNLTASADTTKAQTINFVQMRVAQSYTSEDGKTGVRFYKESNGAYEMFVAKTDSELKADTKYLISMYYKSAVSSLQPQIALMNTDSRLGWDESGNYLGHDLAAMPREAYSEWRRVSFTVDTTGLVDDTHKYLSFVGKGFGGAAMVDYAICDITVDEIDDSFEFSFPSNGGQFGYIDDGERRYADYTCPNTYYTGIRFGAKINAQPATEYMLMFDYYKPSGWFNGSPSLKIDSTEICKLNLPGTTEWKTYQVKIKTPDVITKQEIGFSASTGEGNFSISLDNFRLVKLDSSCVYPKQLKDMAFYQTDTNEYGWQFSSTATSYITAGFVTDYVLEPDSKYLVEFDYINPVDTWWSEPLSFGVTHDDANGAKAVESVAKKQIVSLGVKKKTEWTSAMVVVNTGSYVDDTDKYLGVYGKFGEGSLPQIAFKNMRISKLNASALYPTYLKDMAMYKTEEGDLAWRFNPEATEYVQTGFATGYALEAGKAYAVSFDYKQPSSSWNQALFFTVGKTGWEDQRLFNNKIGDLNLKTTNVWENKTVVIKTDDYLVYDDNKYLWVVGQTIGLPDFHFKNLTVTEINASAALTNYEEQFEYFVNDNGELEWNFSKTTDGGEYSLLGFSTDLELKKDKGYVAVFDYKYATKGWLNNGVEIAAAGTSSLGEIGSGKVVLNDDRYTGDNWQTCKTAYIAGDVTEDNKYFGFVAKTAPGVTYDISIKNVRLYDLGDVDFNGKIDSKDLVLLRQDLLGADVTPEFTDVNDDGKTNILDLIRLKKTSAK